MGDVVECAHTNTKAIVDFIEDEHVFCISENGTQFYRTWSHDLDTVMRKSGGGLRRVHRPELVREERL